MAGCENHNPIEVSVLSPDYVNHYPCYKKVQLTAVKRQIYHPNLPTLRAMDRDNVMHKLADDHCQTTTCCTSSDFTMAALNPFQEPITVRTCPDVAETGKPPNRMYNTTHDVRKAITVWSRYCNQPQLFQHRPEDKLLLEDDFDNNNLHFDGKRVKLIQPKTTVTRMKLTSEPHLDPNGFKLHQPTPYDINSRYRHVHPIFFRDMSGRLWRNPDPRAEHASLPYIRLMRRRED